MQDQEGVMDKVRILMVEVLVEAGGGGWQGAVFGVERGGEASQVMQSHKQSIQVIRQWAVQWEVAEMTLEGHRKGHMFQANEGDLRFLTANDII